MKVKSFYAEKVYGYLNFNISFNEDVSFLVGSNGSGKTTALQIMNALVMPSFKELMQIPFQYAALEVEDRGERVVIFSCTEDDVKILKISGVEEEIRLPNHSDLELGYYSHNADKIEEIVSAVNRKFSNHEVVKKISSIISPIFLGLDRRKERDEKDDYYLEREMYLRRHNKNAMAAKRLIKGSLGVSLMETEILVQNAYRRLREVEDRRSGRLRDSILLSAFQYTKFDVDEFVLEKNDWREKAGLLRRQKEIKEALEKIGVKDSRLSTQVDNFFHQLTSLFEELSASDKELNIEWLLNKAQIDRMAKIVEIIDEHKSSIDDLFEPVNRFIAMMNDFYIDSKKEIDVDAVGQLVVKRPDGVKTTIEGLSSGERQLLVLFAHAFFGAGFRGKKKSNVFIIDEPELSLHLRWQEKFADSIFSVSPGSQFILATHSPEIVGVNKSKAIGCR